MKMYQMHQNMKCIRKENKKIDKLKKPKTLLLNKQNIKMTSLKISGEAKLQLVFCNQSQQLTVVPRLLQPGLTTITHCCNLSVATTPTFLQKILNICCVYRQ